MREYGLLTPYVRTSHPGSSSRIMTYATVSDSIRRNLLFVCGKGGVGKTVVSQAIALALSAQGRRTLWVTFEDPTLPLAETRQINRTLWHLNCEASTAFEEYAGMKIGLPGLTQVFVRNKLMRYLSKAAPGIHELVLLGKVWYERKNYDHVVVDMPSTGYGLAMFQSTENFARLFRGGPIHRDAEAMLATFRNPAETGHLVVSLPEEMPLQESLELSEFLGDLFPRNPVAWLVNRRFPPVAWPEGVAAAHPKEWTDPLAASALDYARKRTQLEAYNLRLWEERGIRYAELPYIPPAASSSQAGAVVGRLAERLRERSYA